MSITTDVTRRIMALLECTGAEAIIIEDIADTLNRKESLVPVAGLAEDDFAALVLRAGAVNRTVRDLVSNATR